MYCSRILVTSVILAGIIYVHAPGRGMLKTLGDVLMQVISFFSTSGYIISDCSRWPAACAIIILVQMFIGACAVSTGGGLKEARIIIAAKTISLTIYRHVHPSSVRTMMFNRKPLTNDQVVRANLFIVLFMISFLGGALLLSLDTISVADALNYSQAMLTNTGTSIGELTKPATVANFSGFSKAVMCLLMIAGRLEIYPFIMIFLRNFWKSDSAV
jgi:trk system potassium uptake protein TrkH